MIMFTWNRLWGITFALHSLLICQICVHLQLLVTSNLSITCFLPCLHESYRMNRRCCPYLTIKHWQHDGDGKKNIPTRKPQPRWSTQSTNGECFLFWDEAADCVILCKQPQRMDKKEKQCSSVEQNRSCIWRLLVALRQRMLMETGPVRRVIIRIVSTSCRRDSRVLARCYRMPRKQAGKSMGVFHCFLPRFVNLSLRKRMISRKLFWKTNQPIKTLDPTPSGPCRLSWNREVPLCCGWQECLWRVPNTCPWPEAERENIGMQWAQFESSRERTPPWSLTALLGLLPHLPV